MRTEKAGLDPVKAQIHFFPFRDIGGHLFRVILKVKGRKSGVVGKDRGRDRTALNAKLGDYRNGYRQRAAAESSEIIDHGKSFLMLFPV